MELCQYAHGGSEGDQCRHYPEHSGPRPGEVAICCQPVAMLRWVAYNRLMDASKPRAVTPESFERFGELLRYLRLRARLTQRELSIAVGYNFAQISRLESGLRLPDPAVIRAVFVSALDLSSEPGWVQRLLALAEEANREAHARAMAAAQPSALPQAELPAQRPTTAEADVLPLLATKLSMPQTRPSVVFRPRLRRQLEVALTVPLTLVVAGAGFGKTTLLVSWLAERVQESQADGAAVALAWLALDAADNDQATFLRYLVAALQTVQPGAGNMTLALLQLAQPPAVPALLTPLLNDLMSLPRACLLVLDDYHLMSAPAIHDTVRYLVEHLPPLLHLILSSRVEPPLPLARLRARGSLVELRAADLRFTSDEAFALLHDALGIQVTPEQAGVLETRTEGWAAGLQLAALALRGRTTTAELLAASTGNNRYIADYLATEVLEQLLPHLRSFVLQTALLDRFCAPLCDAVIAMGDQSTVPNAAAGGASQLLLAELDQAQLFLIALDDERRWYRYHHLFAEMVRARFEGEAKRGDVEQVHLRAASWFEQAGLIDEAIRHALAADNLAGAVAIVARQAGLMVAQGNLLPLRRWLDQLPVEAVQGTPRLAISGAMVAIASGDAQRGATLLAAARTASAPAISFGDWLDHPQEAADLVELTLARAEAAWSRAYHLAQDAVQKPLAGDLFLRAWARWELGVAALQCDHVAEARTLLADLFGELTPQMGGLWLQTAVALGRTTLLQGDSSATAQVYALVLQQNTASGGRGIGQIHLGLAALHYAWGELAIAEVHARTAYTLGAEPPNALLLIAGATWLARIALARGEATSAQEWMHQVAALHPQLLQPFLLALIIDELVQALLGSGAADQAYVLLEGSALATSAIGRLAASRIALASGDAERTVLLAGTLAEHSVAQGLDWITIEALLVRVQAVLALGRPDEAVSILPDALRMALRGQLVQPFREAGSAVHTLLEGLESEHPDGVLRVFIGRIRAL
jgi:LuxR family transcriptional regulator, maltose regulon positive regulatory protein